MVKPLDEVAQDEQVQRYLTHLPNRNFILTDYLEFRWYVEGEHRQTARLARVSKGGRNAREKDGGKAVTELLTVLLSRLGGTDPEAAGPGVTHGAAGAPDPGHYRRRRCEKTSASATLLDLHGAF